MSLPPTVAWLMSIAEQMSEAFAPDAPTPMSRLAAPVEPVAK
jgi:hypothetical protein